MECISIKEARYITGHRVWLNFNTGETGEIDLHDLVFSHRAAEPLRDPAEFAKFYLDSWPTLAWDCGYDIDPESLYARVTGKKQIEIQSV